MAKISNTAAYPSISNIDAADYLVITDAENNLMTKTATIAQIQSQFGIDTQVAHVTVNSASLLGSPTNRIVLLPSPGTGKVIDLLSVQSYLDAGSQAYNFASGTGFLLVEIDSVSFGGVNFATLNSATDVVYKSALGSGAVGVGGAVVLSGTGATVTQGNGNLYLNIYYRVLTVGSSF